MDEPVTELDERFSDAGAQATTWASTREALEAAQLSWVSTVRADGRPHVTPLVAVWLDGADHFTTGPGEQKAVNLAVDPNCTLTTGNNAWKSRLDVATNKTPRGSARDTSPAACRPMAAVANSTAVCGRP